MVQINKKFLFIILAVILTIIILDVGAVLHSLNRPRGFKDCADAHAHQVAYIPKSSSDYRPSLDRDGDGYACE